MKFNLKVVGNNIKDNNKVNVFACLFFFGFGFTLLQHTVVSFTEILDENIYQR